MIKLLRDGTTTFVATVTELTTISNPEYLFEFIEEQTDNSVYCILADTSTETTRFNEFSITDGTDVNFSVDGFYTYKIYEQANGSGNLDPDGLTMVEEGRAYVYVVDTSPNEYENTSETSSVYEPE
jgi:hypothetical protein